MLHLSPQVEQSRVLNLFYFSIIVVIIFIFKFYFI